LKVDPDRDFEWRSREGFRVLRIDAAYSENVLQRRIVYSDRRRGCGLKTPTALGDGLKVEPLDASTRSLMRDK
jgi:hypothetical protein